MGRLFWKFFLSILLAQIAATVGIGGAFWLRDQARHRTEAAELDSGMPAQYLLDAAGMTLKHGGVPALRDMVSTMRRHTIYLLDAKGSDLLGRSVPAELRANAAAQLKEANPHAAVRSLQGPDGQRYLAFVPRFDLRATSGMGPQVRPEGPQDDRPPGGDAFAGVMGGPGPGDAMRGPPGGPMVFGYRVGRI